MNHGAPDPHRITLLDTGETFACRAEESVLHGLARLGRRGIPVGCRGGGCGICKVEVVSGDFGKQTMSRDHISPEDEAHHRVLACRIRPVGDLTLRVLGRMQKAVFSGLPASSS
jgi:ferredoxin